MSNRLLKFDIWSTPYPFLRGREAWMVARIIGLKRRRHKKRMEPDRQSAVQSYQHARQVLHWLLLLHWIYPNPIQRWLPLSSEMPVNLNPRMEGGGRGGMKVEDPVKSTRFEGMLSNISPTVLTRTSPSWKDTFSVPTRSGEMAVRPSRLCVSFEAAYPDSVLDAACCCAISVPKFTTALDWTSRRMHWSSRAWRPVVVFAGGTP